MDNLNVFQKIRIILLVLIIIAVIVLGISAVKIKDKQNYSAKETFSDVKEVTSSAPKQVSSTPVVTEVDPGDVQESDDTSWDEQNVEETKVDKEDEENGKTKYYIKINYTANVVTVYTKAKSGKYTVPAKAMICSTGKATPTSGVYKMSSKYRWHQLNGGVYGQYCTRITGHILFHSVPYAKNTPDSLKYIAYDKLGTKASAGCIRLTVADAMWIYNNCASGTYVEFYSSSDPGPLGKPSAQKISSNEQCRNWDPTDPAQGNPWHTYTEPNSTSKEEEKKENNTTAGNSKKEESNNKKEKQVDKQETKNTSQPQEQESISENDNTQAQNQQDSNLKEEDTEKQENNETKEQSSSGDTETTNESEGKDVKDNNEKENVKETEDNKEDDKPKQETSESKLEKTE